MIYWLTVRCFRKRRGATIIKSAVSLSARSWIREVTDTLLGVPLSDLKVLEQTRFAERGDTKGDSKVAPKAVEKSPAAIQFVRNRMLYARPVLNSRGVVTFGLRHIRKPLLVDCCRSLC